MSSNLRDVIDFEVKRNLKKKTFWYTTIALPVIIIAIFAINYASSSHADKSSQQQTTSYSKTAKLAVFDDSGLLNQQKLIRQRILIEPNIQAGITQVKDGNLTAFFYYPKNVAKVGIQVYAQDQGITFTPPYNTLAIQILKQSVITKIRNATNDPQAVQILQTDPNVTATTYKNGVQTKGLASTIAPGLFFIAFIFMAVMLSYFMISATTEEKENRAAEILLTTVKSRSLIIGKIFSVLMLGIVQVFIIIVPLLIAYAIFHNHVSLPGGVSLSHIPLDTKAIVTGIVFLGLGLTLYTGILVGFGSLFPTAQEASRYLFLVIIWILIPLYSLGFVVSTPHALIVTVFTYFPLTAPSTVLLRNVVGTISTNEILGSFVILLITALLAILFAIRAFSYGAMTYTRRINVKELFR